MTLSINKIPVPRTNYIHRSNLQAKLLEINQHQVTIIKAGAGTGKTTLMAIYIKEQQLEHPKWLTLDSNMNQLLVFWNYLLNTCQGQKIDNLKLFLEGTDPKIILKKQLIHFCQQIPTSEQYLVLDNFQNITDKNILETLNYFITIIPDNFHLILLTRTMPNFDIGRLYMNGTLAVIGEADMRLNNQECQEFLTKTLNLSQANDVIDKIVTEANGWIGGAQLMAISGKLNYQKPTFFTSANEMIMYDYIDKEIFSSLSMAEQSFLEKTSILSYFNKQICDNYLLKDSFDEMIKQISEKNLFVIKIDEATQVYSYHAILREFLLYRLDRDKERKKELFNQAAIVMFNHQDYSECVRLLQVIEDYDKLMELLLLMPANIEILGYIMQIPLEEISKNPDFAYQYFFYHFASLELQKCEQIYEVIKKDINHFEGFKHINLFFNMTEFKDLNILSIEQIEAMPLQDTSIAYLLVKEAYFIFMLDANPLAFTYLDKAEQIYRQTGNEYIKVFILEEKTQMLEEYGEFNQALALYGEMKDKFQVLPMIRDSYYIGIAGIYIRQMRIQEAKQELDNFAGSDSSNIININSAYLYTLAEWYYLVGDLEKTKAIIDQLSKDKVYDNILFSAKILRYPIYRHNDRQLAQQFLESYENSAIKEQNMDVDLLYIGILYDFRGYEQAIILLNQLLAKARKRQCKLKIIECSLMKSRFLYNHHDAKQNIFNCLLEALVYAIPEANCLPFWFEKDYLKELLETEALSLEELLSSKQLKFINKIITWQSNLPAPNHYNLDLTEREMEVLKEMAKGSSNKVIANNLNISIATVKTHLINIYSKLGVNNRIAAINKLK